MIKMINEETPISFAAIEKMTDVFYTAIQPKIEKNVGDYDNSRIHEKLDLIVSA